MTPPTAPAHATPNPRRPRRAYVVFVVLLALISGAAAALSLGRMSRASAQHVSAQDLLHTASRDVQELVSLQGQQQRIELRERPAQDVIAQVNTVLAGVGLPAKHFKSLAPEAAPPYSASASPAERSSTKTQYRTQSLRLSLEDLSPAELGAFLLRWRESQPVWAITRIELTHPKASAARPNRYDANLLLTAIYLADA